jgi:two-component system, LytTR family, response regulator
MYRDLKVLIVDDEPAAVENIEIILESFIDNVTILGKATDIVDAAKKINQLKPDLVFLDIDMPPFNGFDLLDMLPDKNFKVIFITAYETHALKAFRYAASNYLLKPIDIDELEEAINNVRNDERKLTHVSESISKSVQKLKIFTQKGTEFINTEDIEFIKADGSYCTIHLVDGTELLVSKPLKEIANSIDELTFFRSHKSYLVNLKSVVRLQKDGYYIELKSGLVVELSRRKKQSFLDVFENA